MSSSSNFSLTTPRLRASKIDFFEQDLIRLKQEGYTNQQLFTWVEEQAQGLDQGSKPTMRTLENRLAEWGARHNTSIPITDELSQVAKMSSQLALIITAVRASTVCNLLPAVFLHPASIRSEEIRRSPVVYPLHYRPLV
jgi:hypothetical protein